MLKLIWLTGSTIFLVSISVFANFSKEQLTADNLKSEQMRHVGQRNGPRPRSIRTDPMVTPELRAQRDGIKKNGDKDDRLHMKIRRTRTTRDKARNTKTVPKENGDDGELGSTRKDGDDKHPDDTAPSKTASPDAVILRWLRERNNKHGTTSSGTGEDLSQLLSDPQYFDPGTLPLSQLSSLQQCYADPTIYRKHFMEGSRRRIPYSETHNLAYLLIPKSGSSTGRFMMKHEFDAVERPIEIGPSLENSIAFVREPLSRFYSQYDEAFVRTAPWHSVQNSYYRDPNNDGRQMQSHPFPYLHENLESYHDYEDVFCPPSTRKSRRDCIYRASAENGTLASRLERFVMDYDGRSPFDIHLALQVPLLSDVNNGRSIYVTELHNTTNAEGDWNSIARRYLGEKAVLGENAKKNKKNADKESGGVIKGRSYPRRFDAGLVGRESERRICELALLDYCCLNFPLPEVCGGSDKRKGDDSTHGGGGGAIGSNLSCKMDYDKESRRIRIQPGIFPQRRTI